MSFSEQYAALEGKFKEQVEKDNEWSTTIILAALRQLLWPLGVRCNCRL